MKCPKCNSDCDRDEVDNGVGMQYGPWGCPNCGWSSDPAYDMSNDEADTEEGTYDQFGGFTPRQGERMLHDEDVDILERDDVIEKKAHEEHGDLSGSGLTPSVNVFSIEEPSRPAYKNEKNRRK